MENEFRVILNELIPTDTAGSAFIIGATHWQAYDSLIIFIANQVQHAPIVIISETRMHVSSHIVTFHSYSEKFDAKVKARDLL